MVATRRRLSVETLEHRWCPALTITKFGTSVVIVGDSANDSVIIQYNGANGNAYVDGNANGGFGDAADRTFTGINQFMIQLGGGDDQLQFNLAGTLTRAVQAQIDLGDGANALRLNLGAGINAPAGQAQFTVQAGAGADSVTASLGGIAGGLGLDLSLGDGNNSVNVQGNSFISAQTDIRVETGRGLDTVVGSFAGTLDCSDSGQSFNFTTKLGDGRDNLTLGFQDLLTNTNLSLDTGAGNDRVAVAAKSVACSSSLGETRLQMNLDLGAGNDQFDGQLSGDVSDTTNAAAASFSVNAGKGDDTLTFDAFSDIGRPPRGGALALSFIGDRGDDVMAVNYAGKQATVTSTAQGGALTREASLNITLSGGAGNDTIGLNLNRTDKTGKPVIHAKIYGGDDNDNLSFTLKGKGAIRGKQLIDAGGGKNKVKALGGVTINQ